MIMFVTNNNDQNNFKMTQKISSLIFLKYLIQRHTCTTGALCNSDLITHKTLIIIPLILYMIVSSILYYIAFSIVQREWKNCIMYAYWNVFWNFVFVVCDTLCCPRKTCPMTSRYKLTVNSRMPSHPFYCEFPFIHWYL